MSITVPDHTQRILLSLADRPIATLVKRHGINPNNHCPIFSEFVADFVLFENVSPPSAHTVLFIAADARGVPVDVIGRVAERLLASGVIYVCMWGPDCERVHDIFDEVYIGDGSSERTFKLTSTWHSDETIGEAIGFFIGSAVPSDSEMDTTSYLAVAVGNPDWAMAIDHALSVFARQN
ncbi:MAG: hypothetical protein JWM68_5821 [Verrucomicrobiales bacterium]|nr:hypothetical protein [Verrucomicrobiales bacterium]